MTRACSAEILYRDHSTWLQSWFRSRLGCPHQAADLAHDTFVRVLVQHDECRWQPLRKPRAFLRIIANGLLVDHYRRRSLERSYLEALAAMPEAVTISLEDKEILLETLHRIDAMLVTLPEPVRRAFLLSQLEGLTYAQIAEQMRVSVRTIKRYMQQGFSQCLAAML